jgi:hypothetical protein
METSPGLIYTYKHVLELDSSCFWFINLCYLLEILTRETSSTLPPPAMLVDSEPSSIVLVEDFQDPFAAGATTQLSAHGHMKGQISMCVPNLWRKRRSERKKRCCRTYKVQDKVLCRVMMIECLALRYDYIFFILSHACCSLILFIAECWFWTLVINIIVIISDRLCCVVASNYALWVNRMNIYLTRTDNDIV